IDECAGVTCFNGGVCIDEVNAFTCQCAAGFSGNNCESVIDPCMQNPCENNGVCESSLTDYTCQCPQGYTGARCETGQSSHNYFII
ncbi:fibropellin-3-like, partial [Anneissia japonica]|uniref:fibropellin-3-like n=1 Tax=Anneissia japonica TaxID=1529436 RepID=UPI00142560C4